MRTAKSNMTLVVNCSLSLSTTPSAVMLRTWRMFTHGGGGVTELLRVPPPVETVSLDFVQFSFRLLSSDEDSTFISSLVLVFELSAGTMT